MSRKSNRITIYLHVGDQFIKELRRTMEDEFKIACKKWKVSSDSNRQKDVIESSFEQLFVKIYEVTKHTWDGKGIIEVRASSANALVKDFHLPREVEKYGYLRLVRMRDGWTFTKEDTDGTISIEDFQEAFTDILHQWARTAVYYGVASYTIY